MEDWAHDNHRSGEHHSRRVFARCQSHTVPSSQKARTRKTYDKIRLGGAFVCCLTDELLLATQFYLYFDGQLYYSIDRVRGTNQADEIYVSP